MVSIHDSIIKSYTVDLENNKIYFDCKDDDKNIKIVFTDVLVHFFEDELSGSVLNDIDEKDIESFLKENKKLLEEREGYCWPMYYKTIEELKENLLNEEYLYYIINSSYGLSGWVLAKKCDVIDSKIQSK